MIEDFNREFVKGQLEAVGYDETKKSKLPVIEMFKTLQGEGPSIGTPSVFVRFAVCNLACVWCDTKYTWVPQLLRKERVRWYEVDELFTEIAKLAGKSIRNVVFTGGEPMLWWNNGLSELVETLGSVGYSVEIETNGTVKPEGSIGMPFLRFNVSFKLSNNVANRFEERIRSEALNYFNELAKMGRAVWKIVITGRKDLEELVQIMGSLGLEKSALVLMPEMTDASRLREYSWLAEWCIENGVRLISRLHIELWGNERGR